jgi:hypothetical protein
MCRVVAQPLPTPTLLVCGETMSHMFLLFYVCMLTTHMPTRAGANLSGADLSNSTLTGVKLSEAKLHGFPPTKLPQGFQP